MSVIKRMTERFHIGSSKGYQYPDVDDRGLYPTVATPSLVSSDATLYDHRGSLSTQRTSFSELSSVRRGLGAIPEQDDMEARLNRLQLYARNKGTYRLEDFYIQRTLGTGSFGRVLLVRSKHNLRFYAIKVLNKDKVVRMKQIEHTNNERDMLHRVNHNFIINLWGAFQDGNNLYMVMDFVPGGELFSLLRRSHRFPEPVAKFYAAEVSLALRYLHSNGIIYRDLKPENILLNADGHIKVADFGFAKLVDTVAYTLCGTPDYLAPEIIFYGRYNKSVDWYALGVLCYEMLSGLPPFHTPDGNPQTLYAKIRDGTSTLRWNSPNFSLYSVDLIQKLMESDPSKRYGNMRHGAGDVFAHAWFAEVDWEKLEDREVNPPYMPHIDGAGDASAFDIYHEDGMEELFRPPPENTLVHEFPNFDYAFED
ncbi:putative cyclic AMP-dependent protein kinase catalytic subunit [Schizophyllum amplum]|uniref:cAMP-dependent protein kinase n=1 Tax=Schizophyllum amplum TaxID=97359 RepID=A0A550CVY9_9AGAR|nr:putative cyclic AMP-dependent protein kinase catalytic subunit [Auriculariopsis ampla]